MITSKQWEEATNDICSACPSHSLDTCENCPVKLFWNVAYGNDLYGACVRDKELEYFEMAMKDNIKFWGN